MNSIVPLLILSAVVCLSYGYTWGKRWTNSKSFDLNQKTNFVVYWGSTDNEGQLSDYCSDNTYDVIMLAFASAFDGDGVPQMSLDSCDGQDCSSLSSQVQSCQDQGKTIMLSVGGADGSYQLASDNVARQVANHLWNMFLGGTGEDRPFGDGIVLDGVDFDIEQGAQEADGYWVTLINTLRDLSKGDSSKHYYLSGAPQCVFPDEWSVLVHSVENCTFCLRFGPGSETAISNADLDFISIQFYNNYCGIQSYFGMLKLHAHPSEYTFYLESDDNFNFAQWSTAVKQASQNMKIILGIPASQGAGDGYQSADNIKTIVDSIRDDDNFAGTISDCNFI